MGSADANPMGVEWFGLLMGLGFVLSFGYWCTDFLVVQRAMAADSMTSARRTPLIAALPKMVFPFLVILPGIIAITLPTQAVNVPVAVATATSDDGTVTEKVAITAAAPAGKGLIPVKLNALTGQPEVDSQGKPVLDYNLAIPYMLLHYFPTGMLGLGLTALLASFMSGMAGNVTAFNTVWTYDIYRAYIKKDGTDQDYLRMGRFATLFGTIVSIGAAYLAAGFNNIMDILQLVFALVNAPLFATFLLGMFWKRATANGAFFGLLAGTLAATIHHGLSLPVGASAGMKGGWIHLVHTYPSEMAQGFWTAIFAWTVCFFTTIIVSLFTKPRLESELTGLVYSLTPKPNEAHLPVYKRPWVLGVFVLAATVALNFIFW
jgi:SSS family solute:Na+ symporter